MARKVRRSQGISRLNDRLFAGHRAHFALASPHRNLATIALAQGSAMSSLSKGQATSDGPGFSDMMLFWASFFTLIAAGIGFSVRNALLKDWGDQFSFTQTELGAITGGGLFGFGMTIIVLSFVADWIGYGKLMLLAFLLYVASAVVTFAATPVYSSYGKEGAYWCLFIGAWLFSLANGTCEAVINPLTATLFPKNKTHWLNILHAGWPGGLILGALLVTLFDEVGGIRWEIKLGMFLAPVLLFGIMMAGRPFPRSEARVQGVSVRAMMGEVGFLGAGVVVFFIGLLLTTVVIPAIPESWVKLDKATGWAIGWGIALAIWLVYSIVSGFRLGHLVLALLYVLHGLVGYVELGTDSWIINIGNQVLDSSRMALIAFIWTNLVMFSLRFFAGPIVHKISPLGLLFVSALLGTAGLVLFSQEWVNSFGLWFLVSTVYAVGKTFYWPTLLGVISERFPKGGALALGFSGGIGMLSAGLLGGPGIGYKQDYFAVQKIQKESSSSYSRYVAKKDDGSLDEKPFPLVTDLVPDKVPPVAGLDNGKLKVLEDHGKVQAGKMKETTLESDLVKLAAEKAKNPKATEDKLEKSLNGMKTWWDKEGKPHYEQDKEPLKNAKMHGARTALLYTAAVPAVMAIGFLLLIIVFKLQGGYQQVHIDGEGHH
jgi:MFS family permease